MKLPLHILLAFTSVLLAFSLKGAKGIEEALFYLDGFTVYHAKCDLVSEE